MQLILLEFNVFRKKYQTKLKRNPSLATYLEFYCIAFIEYMIPGKTLLDYTNLFSRNVYEKNIQVL